MYSAIPSCKKTALWAAVALGFAAWLGSLATPTQGQERNALEEELKMAYLLKFPGFVTWPKKAFANAKAPLVVAVWSEAPLAAAVRAAIEKERYGDRPVRLREVKSWDETKDCHVLYLPSRATIPASPPLALKQPMLIVRGIALKEAPASIAFAREGDRLRFDINVPVARAAGLVIDSKLLKMARRVQVEEEGGAKP